MTSTKAKNINFLLRKRKIWGLFLIIIPLIAFSQNSYTQTGIASYYGKDFHGKKTACGEKYDMYDMTAAHKTLPFNTYLRVTNLANSKSVIVRINDRGPFSKKRIIDLSYKSAQKIGMIQSGVAKVKIEAITKEEALGNEGDDEKEKEKENEKENEKEDEKDNLLAENSFYDLKCKTAQPAGYGIQAGSYREKGNALEAMKKFQRDLKKPAYLEIKKSKKETVYKIMIGEFNTENEASKFLKLLKQKGIEGFVRKY